jgi:hypothetical protein
MFIQFSKSVLHLSTGFGLMLAVMMAFTNTSWAQTSMVAQVSTADSQMKQVCGSRGVAKSSRGSKATYSCTSKPQRAGTSSSTAGSVKAAGSGGLRADIDCSYSESGGVQTWLGCTCKENNDGNCTNFITWCAEQGDEVSGNSGGANCNPGG